MKIGFVLSGGGARGFAHLGAIKALEEEGIRPDCISGTSAGALVGSLIAAGYSPDYIFDLILAKGIRNYLKLAFNRFGLFSFVKVQELLHEHIPHNQFEKLHIPLTVCATNLSDGRADYFSSGELITPVLASCCLPGIFEPVQMDRKTYIDGGVLNNLPIEPLQGKCDFLVGINVTPVGSELPLASAKDILMKSFYLTVSKQSNDKLLQCDVAIQPTEIIQYDGLSLAKAKEIFELGYRYGQAAVPSFSSMYK